MQEVVFENVENLSPSHYVDVFDGNDVPINGVLLNVGHDVSNIWNDPLDGALIEDLLDGPFFWVLCHMLLLLTLSLHNPYTTSFNFYWFHCPGLKFSYEDL